MARGYAERWFVCPIDDRPAGRQSMKRLRAVNGPTGQLVQK